MLYVATLIGALIGVTLITLLLRRYLFRRLPERRAIVASAIIALFGAVILYGPMNDHTVGEAVMIYLPATVIVAGVQLSMASYDAGERQ